jgi:hypothetical protein
MSVQMDGDNKVPTLWLAQDTVNILDYSMIGISGFVFIFSCMTLLYCAYHAWSISKSKAWSTEFNFLWQSRVCSQVLAALYALSLLLRLQILWG